MFRGMNPSMFFRGISPRISLFSCRQQLRPTKISTLHNRLRAIVQQYNIEIKYFSRKMPSEDRTPVLQFAKLSDNATTPTRGSEKAAGYDLYSAAECVVPAKGKSLVPTDIQIAVPDGCYGRVAPRSGLAVKKFIDVGAGVVDHDYRGNVGVVLFNFSDTDFEVKKGDRIAQLICERIFCPELQELPTLSTTARGDKGYGSTGMN